MESDLPAVPVFDAPNLLFGQDVYFSRSASYGAIRNANQQALAAGQIYLSDSMAAGDAAIIAQHEEELVDSRTASDYYAFRFRSRGLPEDLNTAYRQWHESAKVDGAVTRDALEALPSLFGRLLAGEAWATVSGMASHYYDQLPEGDGLRETLGVYAGFSGGILVREYCKQAMMFSDDRLAGEYLPRLKHMITVCWEAVNDLEKFAPEEAKLKRQLVRELLLENIAQTGKVDEVDNYISRLYGRSKRANLRSGMYDDEAIDALYRMDDPDEATKERVRLRMQAYETQALQPGVDDFGRAITIRYKTAVATGQDMDEVQVTIDAMAKTGFDLLMSNYDVDETDYDNRQHHPSAIYESPHVSPGLANQLRQRYQKSQFEKQSAKFLRHRDSKTANDVLLRMNRLSPKLLPNIDRQLTVALCQAVRDHVGDSLDTYNMLSNLTRARGYGLIEDNLPDVFATHLDEVILANQFLDDDYSGGLDDFFPLVASVLRNTDRADNPDDEYFWKVLSKDQVRGYFDAVRRRHGERRPYRYRCVDENDSVPLSVEAEEAAVTTDIRSWFDDVRAGYENSGRA